MGVRLSEASLNNVGVELRDREQIRLECKCCGQQWLPNILPGGRLPRGWWKCPRDPEHTARLLPASA
jgi:hypothetical protein